MKIEKQQVAAVAVSERVCDALERLCAENGWPTSSFTGATEALRELYRRRLTIALVQVSAENDSTIELVRRLRAGMLQTCIVAVNDDTSSGVESQARAAGAQWYFASPDDGGIARLVGSILDRNLERQIRRSAIHPVQPVTTGFSSSPPSPVDPGRRVHERPVAPQGLAEGSGVRVRESE